MLGTLIEVAGDYTLLNLETPQNPLSTLNVDLI